VFVDVTQTNSIVVSISNAKPLAVAVSFERFPRAEVTFSHGIGGSLKAVVDSVPIVSGDSVRVNKSVVFTAVPANGYVATHWTVNGAVIADTALAHTIVVSVSNRSPVHVTVSFEESAKPLDRSIKPLSGVLTFGPSPVRSGGELAIFWDGNKEIGGDLQVLSALGDMIAILHVSGVGKIGAWNTRGVPGGSYLMRGVLQDKDGFRCRILMLVGVAR